MQPVYLISNVHRSGSSMMMRCLIEGGLEGVFNTNTENQIFLKRNPEEIRKSMLEFTPFTSWGREMVVLEFYDEIVGHIISELNKRSDVTLTVLNYRDIVSNPLEAFNKLVFDGWEINPVISASLVDETLHRFKLETDGK